LFELNNLTDGHYAEPYAGGAAVALTLLLDEYVRHIHINDLDRAIYAFWWSVLNEPERFAKLIRDTPVTTDAWERQKKVQTHKAKASLLSLGFSTFFLNRTSRSGIIASGGMIGGADQNGRWKLNARYNGAGLIQRIDRIASYRSRISLTNVDALAFLTAAAAKLPHRSLTYLDPPYFVKGQRRLYTNYYTPRDHALVAAAVDAFPHCWVTSYDYAPEILTLYRHHRCHVYTLGYTAAARRQGAEAIFFSDELQVPAASAMRTLLPRSRAT
jgi:DNA adenine methylase